MGKFIIMIVLICLMIKENWLKFIVKFIFGVLMKVKFIFVVIVIRKKVKFLWFIKLMVFLLVY